MMTVSVDGSGLTIEMVEDVARRGAKVELTDEAVERIEKSRAVLEELVASGEAIYGVTTGIGEFARIRVDPEMGSELQRRIIYSHAAGTGDLQPDDAVRAAILLRINTLAKGYSGVRLKNVQIMLDCLNKGVTPIVFEKGSLGVSGDLSPLAQLAEVFLGEGEAFFRGVRMPGAQALKMAGLQPVDLSYKEGLGFINGSQMLTGEAALRLVDARRIIKHALIASAMTIDALKGVQKAYDARLHAIRPFKGQIAAAAALRRLFDGSEIMADPSGKVQDGYSMRCTPQVHGPTIDAWFYTREQVEIEMNSAADNPVFIPDDKAHLAGGNFHGQAVGIVMDLMAIGMSELADLSERHTNRLLNPALSGLPDFLVEGRGVNSGLMVSQYTAAALVSENKVLSHPATVDSISVSADQEDHVAMAPIACRKLKEIQKNVVAVLAIEMNAAAQAFDFRAPLKPGRGTRVAHDIIRRHVPHLEDDRPLYPDINKIADLISEGTILNAVEKEVGEIELRLD
jgi:histidine ammonia-lyase